MRGVLFELSLSNLCSPGLLQLVLLDTLHDTHQVLAMLYRFIDRSYVSMLTSDIS